MDTVTVRSSRDNMDDLVRFVRDLSTVAPEQSKQFIWGAEQYLLHQSEKTIPATLLSFNKWLRKHEVYIKNRDDTIFNITVTGTIAMIINQIGNAWLNLDNENKKSIWLWMDHFLVTMPII